ncbi:DUF4142 domain-containing protein [Sorangium sp. So ce341]|uniref:DUF4142 domain-containing protein n=1 Tax=Sorangium sp. So ce341 TaxID=3133302 RepID=UPI003F636063
MLASGSPSLTIPAARTQMLGADNRQVSATARRYRARSKQMLGNRSGRLMAIMFAGSFVLAGAGGCIGGDEDAEAGREGTAGEQGTGRGTTDADRSGGQTGRDGARGGGRSGGEQRGGQPGQRGGQRGGQADQQGGQRGGQAGGQRVGGAHECGEQAGYQGGRQGGRDEIGSRVDRQGDRGQAGRQGAMQQGSEAEITMLVSLIHQKEVQLSEIARDKAESPEVQRYAEQIIEEHSQAGQRGAELSKGGRASIEACSRCEQLEASSTELSESLEDQEGAEFDIAYIWAQVSFHRRALELLDMPFVASADNARLRAQVKAMRADVEQHLREAEQLFCTLLQEQQQGDQQQGAQRGQQGGQQQGGQYGQQGVQQQGGQYGQQGVQQQGGQYGQQGVQQQGPQKQAQQQRGQQQGAQFGQQGVQQRGQQGAQSGQQGAQFGQQGGQQQRGQQQGAQLGQQQRGQQQGAQLGQQQRGQQGV